jgi:hypothetical protein
MKFVFTFVSIIAFATAMKYLLDPTDFHGSPDQLQFIGAYGAELQMKDIESVELLEELPEIKGKTNGLALGSYKKGYFVLEGFGSTHLLIHSEKGPFLKIVPVEGEVLVFNYSKKERTELIYTAIQALRKS